VDYLNVPPKYLSQSKRQAKNSSKLVGIVNKCELKSKIKLLKI